MIVTFLGGPMSGRKLHVREHTKTIMVPDFRSVRNVWVEPDEEMVHRPWTVLVYHIVKLFGVPEKAHAIPAE
jgi:hypothetical protein